MFATFDEFALNLYHGCFGQGFLIPFLREPINEAASPDLGATGSVMTDILAEKARAAT
jgi:hypothetical protein